MLKLFNYLKQDKSRYTILMLLCSFFALLKTVTVAKLYDSSSFGMYSYIFLIQSFGMYFFTFGINEGLIREMTIAFAKDGQSENYQKLKNGVTSWCILVILCASPLFLLGTYFYLPTEYKNTIPIILILSVANTIYNIFSIDLKSKKDLLNLATINFLKTFLAFIVIFPFYFLGWSVHSLLIAESSFVLIFSFYFFFSKSKICFCINQEGWTHTIQVAKIGIAFNFTSFIKVLGSNIDKIIAINALTVVAYGSYSFLMILCSIALTLQGIIGTWFQPRVISSIIDNNIKQFYIKAIKLQIFSIFIALATFIPAHFVLRFFVLGFFPQYETMLQGLFFVWLGCAIAATGLYENFALALGAGKLFGIFNFFLVSTYCFAIWGLQKIYFPLGIQEFSIIFFIYQLLQSFVGVIIFKISIK